MAITQVATVTVHGRKIRRTEVAASQVREPARQPKHGRSGKKGKASSFTTLIFPIRKIQKQFWVPTGHTLLSLFSIGEVI